MAKNAPDEVVAEVTSTEAAKVAAATMHGPPLLAKLPPLPGSLRITFSFVVKGRKISSHVRRFESKKAKAKNKK